jgi:hypothetical protein
MRSTTSLMFVEVVIWWNPANHKINQSTLKKGNAWNKMEGVATSNKIKKSPKKANHKGNIKFPNPRCTCNVPNPSEVEAKLLCHNLMAGITTYLVGSPSNNIDWGRPTSKLQHEPIHIWVDPKFVIPCSCSTRSIWGSTSLSSVDHTGPTNNSGSSLGFWFHWFNLPYLCLTFYFLYPSVWILKT